MCVCLHGHFCRACSQVCDVVLMHHQQQASDSSAGSLQHQPFTARRDVKRARSKPMLAEMSSCGSSIVPSSFDKDEGGPEMEDWWSKDDEQDKNVCKC